MWGGVPPLLSSSLATGTTESAGFIHQETAESPETSVRRQTRPSCLQNLPPQPSQDVLRLTLHVYQHERSGTLTRTLHRVCQHYVRIADEKSTSE
jgi:hypothetical protein